MLTEPRRLSLARLNTPIEYTEIDGRRIALKRDDLTGAALTGNKIRKLEYLLADALSQGATRVITCGGIQSNHCRATAIAATRVGLKSLLFLRSDAPPDPDAWTGNLRLDQLVGAEVTFITRAQYQARNELMSAAAGPGDYVIPEGGSNALGSWGYVRAYRELREQWTTAPTSIVCATGSGGTLAGLYMGARIHGDAVQIHGVHVCDDGPTFQNIVARISTEGAQRFGLPRIQAEEVSMIGGYIGPGYAQNTPAQVADIERVARTTGHLLDPVYTGKAFRALLHEPERFGARPLFIHTGGIYGLLR